MKPVPFDYIRPKTLAEACAVLTANPDAVIIAGGQTLTPMLAMRLARPSLLVDIQRLDELKGIARTSAGVEIGAATRQRDVELSDLIARDVPLLAAALPWVGHRPTRTRGTIGGSLANADPSAEIGLTAVTLDAQIDFCDAAATGRASARRFFVGPMQTALPSRACLTKVTFPVWTDGAVGVAFDEISARRSDFALVSAAAQVAIDGAGLCLRAVLGIGGAAAAPFAIDVDALVGSAMPEVALVRTVEAGLAGVGFMEDPHVSAGYRERVARMLGLRVLRVAFDKARVAAGGSA